MKKLLYEILLGYRIFLLDGVKFRINSPSVQELLDAQFIYDEAYEESIKNGLFDENQYLCYLQEQELWNIDEEKRFDAIPNEIDELKVALHDNVGRANTTKNLRIKLSEVREEMKHLFSKKFKHNFLTAEGVATLAHTNFLVCKTVLPPSFSLSLDEENPFIEKIVLWKNNNRITEKQIRELARDEIWLSYWNSGDPFQKPAIQLSEEQRSLVCISKMYDNIRECPDCPTKEVIDDDDVLDGWLIKQKRKRDNDKNKGEMEEIVNVKGDMVFIPTKTKDNPDGLSAEKINSLNSPVAKAIKNQRITLVQKKGSVDEQDFPDARMKIVSIINERNKK